MRAIHKLSIAMAIVAGMAFQSQAEKLVILHTNDTHSQIDPADDGLGGVARRKAVIDSVRAEHGDNVLLVDAGDVVQGTLFFNLYKGIVEEEVMNALGYDLRILGNHEFDNGMDTLARNLRMARAELLASNYQMRGTPLDSLFRPYAIREFGGKRIAFIPINLQPHGMISDANIEGVGYVDAIETANRMAWALRNIGQADAVVAITHIGYDLAGEDDVEIAGTSTDIDMIIGGHSHTTINPDDPSSPAWLVANADGRMIPVVQTGKSGKYIGELTIDLDNPRATPTYKLIRIDSRLDERADPAIEALVAPYRKEVDALYTKNVARTARQLDKESQALLNFSTDFVAETGRKLAGDIDMAILNKGGLRNSLPAGDISEGHVITLMPFFNRVEVIEISGDSLATAFDTMAAADGNGVSSNVESVYDPSTGKCLSVKISGKPIDPARTYRVATIDYLANGGDYMHSLTDHKTVAVSPRLMYEDMLQYLQTLKGKTINPSDTRRMRPVGDK